MARLPQHGPRPASGDRARRDALDALYAELPLLECKGLCHDSCGPVPMSRVEMGRAMKLHRRPALIDPSTMACPLLVDNRCSVYAVRPMICRLWGLVDFDGMRCHHGCVPERYLTYDEGQEFIRRAMEVGA